jgi:hypothetical protein
MADWRGKRGDVPVRIIFGLLLILLWVVVVLARRDATLSEPDLLWHIKTGEWMWQHGQVTTTDPFSFTFAGEPWIAKEWLSQMIYFAVYSFSGWNGVMLLALVFVALGGGLLYWILSDQLNPLYAALAAMMAVALTSSTFTVRPHLLTLVILVCWTHQLFAASRKLSAPHFGWLLLLVLWANLHAAFTMGFVIAFFAFLDFLERARLTRQDMLVKWLVFLALCPIVSLIHPYLWNAMLVTLTVIGENEAIPLINEWQPFNAQRFLLQEIALLLLTFGTLVSGFRLGIAKALLIVLLLHLFFTHIRFTFFLFPVLAILVAPELARQFPKLSAEYWRGQPRDALEQKLITSFRPVFAAFAAVLLAVAGLQAFVLRTAPLEASTATGAIEFAKSHNVTGNVFNHYNFGGTLIFHGFKTFLDGRPDQLFLGGFTKKFTFGPATQAELAEAFKKYDIRWTMLPPEDARLAMLDEMPGWKRVFSDENAVIHQLQEKAAQ